MSDADRDRRRAAVADVAERIDAACDRFEAAWKAGRRPRIEDYLGEAPGAGPAGAAARAAGAGAGLPPPARRAPAAGRVPDAVPGARRAVDAAFGDGRRPRGVRRPPAAGPGDADRNLLFGLLALQNDFIDRDALLAAFNAWVRDKARPLGQILVDQRRPRPTTSRGLLEALVAQAPAAARRRPRAEPGGPRPARLDPRATWSALADPDLQASLARVGRAAAGPGGRRRRHATPGGGRRRHGGPRFRDPPAARQGRAGRGLRRPDEELHREVALKEIQDRARRRPRQPGPVPAGGRDHRRAGAPGDRPGLRPGHLRRRPALLRHAVHPGRQPQGGHRRASTRADGPRPRPGRAGAGAARAAAAGSSTSATRSPTPTAGGCCTAT